MREKVNLTLASTPYKLQSLNSEGNKRTSLLPLTLHIIHFSELIFSHINSVTLTKSISLGESSSSFHFIKNYGIKVHKTDNYACRFRQELNALLIKPKPNEYDEKEKKSLFSVRNKIISLFTLKPIFVILVNIYLLTYQFATLTKFIT